MNTLNLILCHTIDVCYDYNFDKSTKFFIITIKLSIANTNHFIKIPCSSIDEFEFKLSDVRIVYNKANYFKRTDYYYSLDQCIMEGLTYLIDNEMCIIKGRSIFAQDTTFKITKKVLLEINSDIIIQMMHLVQDFFSTEELLRFT